MEKGKTLRLNPGGTQGDKEQPAKETVIECSRRWGDNSECGVLGAKGRKCF